MTPNQTLADEVFAALKPHLGTYSGGDSGPAFWTVDKSFAMTAEGLQEGTKVVGLECILGLFPDPSFSPQYEFGSAGMTGVLYYSLCLKAWEPNSSVIPALETLISAFPLMTMANHRQPRKVPSDLAEVLVVWIPELW